MSTRLEQPMKAATEDIILNNKQKTFFPEDCAVIAAWAFKTTVLANHIELKGEPYFPVNQRHAFAHHLTIPPGTQVWIGRRNAGHLTANWRSIHRIQQPPTPLNPHLVKVPVSPYRFEHYTCTFTIGYLLLQVVTARWTERKVRERLDFPPILQAEVIDDYAIPIWPKRVSFGWPPPAAVGNAMFDRFWDRFDTINLPGWMR
ncbi:MAG: hypothetical protein LAN37_13505 [Acidobacteriia bacterium]|nr:hypothetical protein [Terriglobia bacterium]